MALTYASVCTLCGARKTKHPSGICSQCRKLSCTEPCHCCGKTGKKLYAGICQNCRLTAKVQSAKQFYPEALDSARMTVYILELAESGLSMNDIAKLVQLSKTAVRNRMRAFLPQRALIPDLIEEIEV